MTTEKEGQMNAETIVTLQAPLDVFIEGRKAERRKVIELLTHHALSVDGDEQERMWTLIHVIKGGRYDRPQLDG